MPLIANADFSIASTGWSVSGTDFTAPAYDPGNNCIIFGNGYYDAQDGDRLEQEVGLQRGQEYALTFSVTKIRSATGDFRLEVELICFNGSVGSTQLLDAIAVINDVSSNVTSTYSSHFDAPVLRIHGAFGNGGTDSLFVHDGFVLACFTAGKRLLTNHGKVEVQDLKISNVPVTHPTSERPRESRRFIRRVVSQFIYIIRATGRWQGEWFPSKSRFSLKTPNLAASALKAITEAIPKEMCLNLLRPSRWEWA